MFLTINGTQYELRFGFKFLKALDELTAGQEQTQGLTPLDTAVIRLGMGDVSIIPSIATAALSYCAQIPEMGSIENALEEYASSLKKGETLCSVFTEALKKAPLHTEAVTRMAGVATKMADMQKQMIEKSMNEIEHQGFQLKVEA